MVLCIKKSIHTSLTSLETVPDVSSEIKKMKDASDWLGKIK
jgi:hypothetical protein